MSVQAAAVCILRVARPTTHTLPGLCILSHAGPFLRLRLGDLVKRLSDAYGNTAGATSSAVAGTATGDAAKSYWQLLSSIASSVAARRVRSQQQCSRMQGVARQLQTWRSSELSAGRPVQSGLCV